MIYIQSGAIHLSILQAVEGLHLGWVECWLRFFSYALKYTINRTFRAYKCINAYCMAYEKEFEFSNVSIVKGEDGKFGIADKYNIKESIIYDSIQPLGHDTSNRYLKVVKDGLIGIYDAVKVIFILPCTLSEITKVENGVVYGKEPFKLFGVVLFNCSVEKTLET